MNKIEMYRANAAECLRMAGTMENEKVRATWLGMAESWMLMIPDRGERSEFVDT
jgi:hypothetical protein